MLDCSDAHYLSCVAGEKDRIGNCHTWIKADPTFEGLKQITYEPDRVQVNASQPDDKVGYQTIAKVAINSPLILNPEIHFNGNMNSIIGGRSTGKSVLLTAMALKLKTDKSVFLPAHKSEYQQFVQGISDVITVYWKDGEVNNEREVEFFQQGYMNELATDQGKLDALIKSILTNKGKGKLLEDYISNQTKLKKTISISVADLFQTIADIIDRESEMSGKGDLKGIQEEIDKLEDQFKKVGVMNISDAEKSSYDSMMFSIEQSTAQLSLYQKDKESIEKLKEVSLFSYDLEHELRSGISAEACKRLTKIYDSIKNEMQNKWKAELESTIVDVNKVINDESQKIASAQQDPCFVKVSNAYASSRQLKAIQDRIIEQKEKLSEIKRIGEEVQKLKLQMNVHRNNILVEHQKFYRETEELLPKLSSEQDGLNIKAINCFLTPRYINILEGALNLSNSQNKQIVSFSFSDNEQYFVHISDILNRLISESLPLKANYSNQTLASTLLTECFYGISYDILYENDNFKSMSDGKKAFVVLKLLLDFSDKKCPILIDQPEDDLDNRAIYQDLVKYIKRKKVQRQIILATHNPNVVVGADSELVIIANQHGLKSENKDKIKFAYKTGSLEHSCPYNDPNCVVLDAQGVREHVCDILEGGHVAFKLREKKYALPPQSKKE